MTRILVIGNGVTGEKKKGGFFIHNNTGNFLSELQKNKGFTVGFCQSVTAYNDNTDLLNFDLKENSIQFEPIRKMGKAKMLFQLLRLFITRLKQYNFFYFFWPGTLSSIIALIALLFNKPIGFYIRGQYYERNILDRFVLKRAKFILTVSPLFLEPLSVFCKNVSIIKPMVSFTSTDIISNYRFTVPQKWRFLYVGRIEQRKGIQEILDAAHVLEKSKLNFQFDLIGGGDLFDTIELNEKYQKLSHRIRFHGQIDNYSDLDVFYKNADCFVLATHDEGFPRVLYEAMSNGLPIFTTMVGGIPGRMQDGTNCIAIPVRNGEKIGEIILNATKNTDLLAKISRNGIDTVTDVLDGKYLTHHELIKLKIEALEDDK